MNLLQATLSGDGKLILMRLDQIAAIQQELWNEKNYGDYKGYWTTKITLISGKEINIREDYDNVQKIWSEWMSLYQAGVLK
jgi:hypothetical protein